MTPGRADPDAARPRVRVTESGDLRIGDLALVPADEIELRTTTSGGPGGQHANRSLTKVVATWRVEGSSLRPAQRARVLEALGPVVRSSASRFRSQAQNREAALVQLGERMAKALTPRATRRPTSPTRASIERRLEEKKSRARTKARRRPPDE